MDPSERVLLPDNILPHRYKLHLAPDLERFIYDGHVDIDIKVKSSANRYIRIPGSRA